MVGSPTTAERGIPRSTWGSALRLGWTTRGVSSSAFGPVISLPVPGFVYLKAMPQFVFGVPERTREVNLVWKSGSLVVFGGEIWTEGFIRFWRDAGNSYGQPQLWYKHGDSSWDFGIEVEVAGSERTVRGGVRKHFEVGG